MQQYNIYLLLTWFSYSTYIPENFSLPLLYAYDII